ncbi:interaptin [Teleopsis dalmanni]|uniref:interaptin n=1 Tax=Teleopsis dalmanni TaxID=139649 RepID=UPI0018CD8B54|nr:interaptin [Teleopsis dalmanni]
MERFAFKINKALKESLYKICRLCGIDNDLVDKVPILNEEVVVNIDDEPQLIKKIEDCVGFTITKDDKMPQNVCRICLDKINDFYEFREMCYATNIQTRKLLGLKSLDPKKAVAKPLIEIKPEVDVKIEVKECSPVSKRPRKRKTDDPTPKVKLEDDKEIKTEKQGNLNTSSSIPSRKKLRLGESSTQKKQKPLPETKLTPKVEINNEPSQILLGALKLKHLCLICDQRFSNKVKLDRHLEVDHIPNILRFVCTTCNEIINKSNDIKNHQLWHKLSKTPYECALCNEKCISIYAYSRHLRLHCCEIYTPNYVLDRQCPQCKETFVTNFLYNIHKCALRTKKCAGCNRIQRTETDYLRHSAICSKTYLNYSKHIPAAIAAEANVWIKNENDVEDAPNEQASKATNACSMASDMTPIVSLTRIPTPLLMSANQCVAIPNTSAEDSELTPQPSPLKHVKKNTKKGVLKRDLKRVDDLLKSTIDTFVSIKHEPEVHVDTDADNVTPLIIEQNDTEPEDNNFVNDDNDFQNDDDDDDYVNNDLPNILENMQHTLPVKQEKIDESYNDTNVEMRIKKENVDNNEAVTTAEKVPVLKIKIKKEHGTLNSSLVDECPIEKKKKKKKRKEDKERTKMVEKTQNLVEAANTQTNLNTEQPTATVIDFNAIRIKQEHVEEPEETRIHNASNDGNTHPEATIMTSIPLLQFQISCVSSGVEFNKDINADTAFNTATQSQASVSANIQEELRDIKPTQQDLDRMLQIMNVSSGIQMPDDENINEPSNTKEANEKSPNLKNRNRISQENKLRAPAKSDKSKKIRAPHKTSNMEQSKESQQTTVSMNSLPYRNLPLNIVIKPEPCNRGYSDEIPSDDTTESDITNALNINQSSNEMETFDSNEINATNALKENQVNDEMNTLDSNETNALHINQQSDEMETFNSTLVNDVNAGSVNQQKYEMELFDNNETTKISPPQNTKITSKEAEEAAYIKSIDFSNIQIKQEKDIDIIDEHVDSTTKKVSVNKNLRNKLKLNSTRDFSAEDNQDFESSSEEEDSSSDSDYDMSDEEQREYREMELPPPLMSENQKMNENSDTDIINNKSNISVDINTKNVTNISASNMEDQISIEQNAGPSQLITETTEAHTEIGSDNTLNIQADFLEPTNLQEGTYSLTSTQQNEIYDKQSKETIPLLKESQEQSKEVGCVDECNEQIDLYTSRYAEHTVTESSISTPPEACIEQNIDKMPLLIAESRELQTQKCSDTVLNIQSGLCDETNQMSTSDEKCRKEIAKEEYKDEIARDAMLSVETDLSTATHLQDANEELMSTTAHEMDYKSSTENPFLITSVYSQAGDNISNCLLPVGSNENGIDSHTPADSNQQQDFSLKISAIASGCAGLSFESTAEVAASESVTLEDEVHEEQHDTSIPHVQALCDSILNNEMNENISTIDTDNTKCDVGKSVTIEGEVSEDKIVTLQAQPYDLPVNTAIVENSTDIMDSNIEEAQNLLNQARLDGLANVTNSGNAEVFTENITDILPSSSVNSLTYLSTISSEPLLAVNTRNEETENIINANRELEDQQQQLFHNNSDSNNRNINRLLLDNSNINEIAENNNNANIEREIQYDNVIENVQQQIAEDNVPYIAEHDVT